MIGGTIMKKVFLPMCSLFLTACSLVNITGGNTTNLLSINVKNTGVKLAISEKQSFEKSSQSLSIKETYQFEENTYTNLPSQEILDNEDTPYDYGAYTDDSGNTRMRYFKYTFYIKNTGNVFAAYNLKIQLNEREKSDSANRSLSDTLRVMVYENDVNNVSENSIHTMTVYAKEAAEYNIDNDGNRTRREFISRYSYLNEEDDEHPLATSFEDNTTIATYSRIEFGKDDIRRYTLVVWLEGEDPQSDYLLEAPASTISFSININGYTKG